jgi:hypothetical protein
MKGGIEMNKDFVFDEICDFGRSQRKRYKYRVNELAAMSVPKRIASVAGNHKIFTTLLAVVLFAFFFSVLASLNPAPATAGPIDSLINGITSAASDNINSVLGNTVRNADNFLLGMAQSALEKMTTADWLTRSFSNLLSEVYPVIQAIHKQAAIPLANVVLLIFLVVGLGKVCSDLSMRETGIDLWKLMWVFIVFTFAKLFIDNSFELMMLAYNVVVDGIKLITTSAQNAGASVGILGSEFLSVSDDINDLGTLLGIMLTSLLAWLICLITTMLAEITIMVRAIQIYTYTALAPVPLAFMVSESSRSMATGFMKRYIALLLAGAIQMVLFCMMSSICGSIGTSSFVTADGGISSSTDLLYSLVSLIAMMACIQKSGSWAKEFVGVG